MVRHRMTDDEWNCVEDVFPRPARTGRPPRDRRLVVDGILWILRTGSPWRDLPEEFGPWATVWDLFDKWNGDGTLDEILRRLRAAHELRRNNGRRSIADARPSHGSCWVSSSPGVFISAFSTTRGGHG